MKVDVYLRDENSENGWKVGEADTEDDLEALLKTFSMWGVSVNSDDWPPGPLRYVGQFQYDVSSGHFYFEAIAYDE